MTWEDIQTKTTFLFRMLSKPLQWVEDACNKQDLFWGGNFQQATLRFILNLSIVLSLLSDWSKVPCSVNNKISYKITLAKCPAILSIKYHLLAFLIHCTPFLYVRLKRFYSISYTLCNNCQGWGLLKLYLIFDPKSNYYN